MAYVKLFGSILASTIWREPPTTRVLWITMLAMADRDGFVEASVPGLADMARLSDDECRRSLAVLSSPDPDSRTKEHEGRRVQETPGGWLILNYETYRDRQTAEEVRERNRLRQERKRDRDRNALSRSSRSVTPSGSGSGSGSEPPKPPLEGGRGAARGRRRRGPEATHIQNMPIGTPSCQCEDCAGYRERKAGTS